MIFANLTKIHIGTTNHKILSDVNVNIEVMCTPNMKRAEPLMALPQAFI
jgi:hypothetical protein